MGDSLVCLTSASRKNDRSLLRQVQIFRASQQREHRAFHFWRVPYGRNRNEICPRIWASELRNGADFPLTLLLHLYSLRLLGSSRDWRSLWAKAALGCAGLRVRSEGNASIKLVSRKLFAPFRFGTEALRWCATMIEGHIGRSIHLKLELTPQICSF